MKIPLSDRLLACCNFVKRGDRVADVGCDHGYLGIYLLTNGIARSVIESDVAEGPLPCSSLKPPSRSTSMPGFTTVRADAISTHDNPAITARTMNSFLISEQKYL